MQAPPRWSRRLRGSSATGPGRRILGYLNKGSERRLSFISVDPALNPDRLREPQDPTGGTAVCLHAGQTGRRHLPLSVGRTAHATLRAAFHIPQAGARYRLPTEQPGDFQLELTEASGRIVSRVAFTVVGARNLAANLEKNAELRLTSNKADYRPGEEIELAITAPVRDRADRSSP